MKNNVAGEAKVTEITYKVLADALGTKDRLKNCADGNDFRVSEFYNNFKDLRVLLTMASNCKDITNVLLGEAFIKQHLMCVEAMELAVKMEIRKAIQKFIQAIDCDGYNSVLSDTVDEEKLNRTVSITEALVLYDALRIIQTAIDTRLPYIE